MASSAKRVKERGVHDPVDEVIDRGGVGVNGMDTHPGAEVRPGQLW
jgi:hypothetical protein